MKWSGTFRIWLRKRVGNRRNACYAQSTLWEELLTLTHQITCRDSINSKGKAQRHFFGESRESVRAESSINLIARFWIISRVAREYLEAPLHRWEPYSRQGGFGPCRGWEGARARKIAWAWIRSQSSLLQISPQKKCVHSKTDQNVSIWYIFCEIWIFAIFRCNSLIKWKKKWWTSPLCTEYKNTHATFKKLMRTRAA